MDPLVDFALWRECIFFLLGLPRCKDWFLLVSQHFLLALFKSMQLNAVFLFLLLETGKFLKVCLFGKEEVGLRLFA